MEISHEEYIKLVTKAAQWDALYEKIAAFYPEEEPGHIHQADDEGGDLGDIGEVAAMAFGFM